MPCLPQRNNIWSTCATYMHSNQGFHDPIKRRKRKAEKSWSFHDPKERRTLAEWDFLHNTDCWDLVQDRDSRIGLRFAVQTTFWRSNVTSTKCRSDKFFFKCPFFRMSQVACYRKYIRYSIRHMVYILGHGLFRRHMTDQYLWYLWYVVQCTCTIDAFKGLIFMSVTASSS